MGGVQRKWGAFVRIVRVVEPSDLEALYRFRYLVYVDDLGWLPLNGSGLVTDEFDSVAHNYAALDECGAVVGGVRVVPDSALGLPLERCSPLDGFRAGKTLVEICRLAVLRDCTSPRLAGLLMKAGLGCALRIGASHVLLDVATEAEPVRLYQRTGFAQLGGEYIDTFHLGQMRSVTMCEAVEDFHGVWSQENPSLYRFFTEADERVVHG